jgi:hypothetical protein
MKGNVLSPGGHSDFHQASPVTCSDMPDRNPDPYLLSGALIEGLASTILQRIPEERRGEVAVEAVRLPRDRLHAYGIV